MTSAQQDPGPLDPTAPATATAAAPQGYDPSLLDGTAYRFVAALGRGGMGEVVEATHVALGKRVVVKLLQERHAGRVDYVDRMRIEAQALAKITHPNLVQVTDFGQTAAGRTFLVMERLVGRDLRQELEQRTFLPVAEAIDVVRQVLAGLAAAHDAGLVHRDVKLDNIFLCDAQDGGRRTVKLLDFGVAKVIGVTGESTPLPLAFPTAEGIAMGTPRFFSPEQARGRPVDARTDIYATGLVLYTLLAGRGPFDHASTLLELTRAHAFQTPEPPSRYASQPIPASLDQIVSKALAKDPPERFPTARTFAAELERIAFELSASPAPRRWDATEIMPGAPKAGSADEAPEPETRRADALPKATPDDDEPPETPTRRLERPMAFMRSPFAASLRAASANQKTAQAAPAPEAAAPAEPTSEPASTEEHVPKTLSDAPTLTLPRDGNALRDLIPKAPTLPSRLAPMPADETKPSPLAQVSAPSTADVALPSDPIIDTLPTGVRAPAPLPEEPALAPDPILDAATHASPLVEGSSAKGSPSEHPPAARGSERPGSSGRAERISALPGRSHDRPSFVPARSERISALPGRSERSSALPSRPERISALPGRTPERTPNPADHTPAEPSVPERRSGLPAAAPRNPPAPLPEERISALPQGGVRPLRAPVPWRRRPAAASSGGARGASSAAQKAAPAESDPQTKLLAMFAVIALLVAGVLLAIRMLR